MVKTLELISSLMQEAFGLGCNLGLSRSSWPAPMELRHEFARPYDVDRSIVVNDDIVEIVNRLR